jgi:hypothetical protein
MRTTACLLGALVTVAVVVGLAARPAVAQQTDARGADRLLETPDLQQGEQPTVEERYPLSSYIVPYVADDGIDFDVGSWAETAGETTGNNVAGYLLAGAGLIARGLGALIQWAFDSRLTDWLADDLVAVTDGMRETIWQPLLLVMVVLGSVWIAWHALGRQRASRSLEGLVWMLGVVTFATVLMAQPGWFFGGLNDLSNELSTNIFAGIAGLGESGGDYHGQHDPTFAGNNADERARRQAADHIWRVLVWEPWRAIVFANDDDADEYGERLLADPSEDTQQAIYDDLVAKHGGDDAYPVQHYAGAHPGTRITVASLALLAALVTGVVLVVLTAAVIILQFAALVLTFLAPLALLIGIHPGTGRVAALQWLELWLGVWIKRVVVTAVLASVIAIHGLIIRHTMQLSWFVAATLIVASGIAALMYRKVLAGMFSRLALASSPGGDAGQRVHQQRTHPARTGRSTTRRATTAALTTKTAGLWLLTRRRTRQQPAKPAASPGGGGGRRARRRRRGDG